MNTMLVKYAIDASKSYRELGWKPVQEFKKGVKLTVRWCLENPTYVERGTSGNRIHQHHTAC